MIKRIFAATGGISFLLFGLLMLLTQLETEAAGDALFLLAPLALLVGVIGLLSIGRAGRLGKAGLWISLSGLGLLVSLTLLGDLVPELPWEFFTIFLFTIPAGLAIYGVSALRSKPLVWGNSLPLLAAASLTATFLLGESGPILTGQIITFLVSLCWAGLGYALIVSRTSASGPAPSSAPASRTALLGGAGILLAVLAVQGIILTANASHSMCPAPIAAIPGLGGPPRPVIFDADMAHDDMIAALYLLQHPGIEVKAITVAGTGEAHCEPGVRNARDLLALHGRPDVPVACGSERPMAGDHVFPDEWRQSADDLYGIRLPENGSSATPLPAPELISSIVEESGEKVTIVAVGPLTNLGEALEADPALAQGIEEIFIMGGAVELGGNVGVSGAGIDNPVAEWNIFIDPHAANIVFASGAPVTLVPLNATRHAPVTTDFYRCIEENRRTPEADLVYRILSATYDFIASGGFQFWDTLTAAILTDESLAEFEMMDLIVVEEEGLASGQTRPDRNGHPVRVAVSADGGRFEALLLEVLNEDGGE